MWAIRLAIGEVFNLSDSDHSFYRATLSNTQLGFLRCFPESYYFSMYYWVEWHLAIDSDTS